MPVWQSLYDDVKDRGVTVVAVAMDTPEAARPFIEAAMPTYPALVDRDHHIAGLFGMVNVPEAVWIDENGRIVRPTESAGSWDAFRRRDRTTGALPEDAAQTAARAKRLYADAVRDWAMHGADSRHVRAAENARQHLREPTEDIALAQTHFRLGNHLLRVGRVDEAAAHFATAQRLHPGSWTMWRQTAAKTEQGFAAGPDFWARVDALGERRYHQRVDMEGMP